MKIVFLDIDGVLNTPASRTRCGKYIGIDHDKLLRLKKIIDETDAKIVLVSTWKEGWEREKSRKPFQDGLANYLDMKFKMFGMTVYDKTSDCAEGIYLSRGEGILEYLQRQNAKSFVILDDMQFDYDGCGLTDAFVKTKSALGLTDKDVQKAVEILNL